MKKIKKILSLFIIGVLGVCSISLVGCQNNNDILNQLNENDFKINTEANNNIEIVALCSEVVTTGTETYISKNLEATITKPDGTTTTNCSWAVRWGTNPLNEDVANYIKVVSQTIKNRVFVNCYKPFFGSTILVEVTDLDTGNTATCVCEYIGIPSTPYFEYENTVYTTYAELTLNKGQYTFDLGLKNLLGPVDASSARFELGEVYGAGEFNATKKEVGGSDNITSTDIKVDMSTAVNNFITCTLNGNTLTCNIKQTVNTYYVTGGRGWIQFKDYTYPATMAGKPMPCTIKIPITEKTTGVSMLIVISPLSNVTLNADSIQF